jgi:hypothetical protein
MYRVTRKQLIRQGGNVIEFEDSCDFTAPSEADHSQTRLLIAEIQMGYLWYGPDKVIFETPTFYRSVTVTMRRYHETN